MTRIVVTGAAVLLLALFAFTIALMSSVVNTCSP